ncbi:MAG: MarR family winged helix-turn-helix transcriptional regulator [Vicinamibacterales bacterium]
MQPADIQAVRRFNRTVAEGIGLIGDRFLDRSRPMGESRILWEIGPNGIELRALRARLGLDSGYLTRVVQSLARQGLLRVRTAAGDRRVRTVLLSARGLRERAELDRRSDEVAARLLAPLTDGERGRLLQAMAETERWLRAALVRFDVEPPTTPDARWCLRQYVEELGRRFEAGFDPARSLPADPADLALPSGLLVIARLRGTPVACGALKLHGRAPAELKRMWVSPDVRGLGLGRRLLASLEGHAGAHGAAAVRLETNRALTEAVALYRASGYREVSPFSDEPYAHHWFEKRLAPARAGRARTSRHPGRRARR